MPTKEAPDGGACQPDVFNRQELREAHRTRKLRIVMEPRHGETCVGLLAVRVDGVAPAHSAEGDDGD